MTRRNWIAEFTEAEVRAALALIGTPESASTVAAHLYALPESEQAHLDWVYDVLLLLSCLSEDLARRVVAAFTPPGNEDARSRIEADQVRFRAALAELPAGRTVWDLGDVVRDRRQDCAIMAAQWAESGARESYVDAFSESEVRTALSQVGNAESAARIAREIYTLPPARQAEYCWTDMALWLFSLVSPETADRVATLFGTLPERAARIREMQRVFRSLQASGELAEAIGAAGVSKDDIIRHVPRPDSPARVTQ
jgi:hypothetical protein